MTQMTESAVKCGASTTFTDEDVQAARVQPAVWKCNASVTFEARR